MRAQGMDVRHDMRLISLVGITEIFGGLPRILMLLRRLKRELAETMPRAIVLVDCPEFNFRIAKMAKKLGIPVYYYISPQIWAWRSGRVHFLREYVRRVICILPFEKPFYEKFGVDVDYVGHPLMDVLPLEELDRTEPDENRIGILPGSRRREVATLLPKFAQVARQLRQTHPDLRFVIARAPGVDRERLLALWPDDIPVDVEEPENRYETFRSCRFILAASGTVTLETALIGTPVIVAYEVSPPFCHGGPVADQGEIHQPAEPDHGACRVSRIHPGRGHHRKPGPGRRAVAGRPQGLCLGPGGPGRAAQAGRRPRSCGPGRVHHPRRAEQPGRVSFFRDKEHPP